MQYIWHKLTWYHYRSKHKIAICSCGWKDKMFRFKRYKIRRPICLLLGHKWGESYEGGFGPIDFKQGDPESVTWVSCQCERCFYNDTLPVYNEPC